MTDIVQRAKQALDGITPGVWWWSGETRARLIAGGTEDSLRGASEIIRCAALLHPGAADAEFIAAAPELVRGLLEELTTKNEVLEVVLASAARYHTERDALRANLPDLLGSAWDDGNAAGLDGWIGPNRGAGDVDDEAVRARERFIRRTLDGDS